MNPGFLTLFGMTKKRKFRMTKGGRRKGVEADLPPPFNFPLAKGGRRGVEGGEIKVPPLYRVEVRPVLRAVQSFDMLRTNGIEEVG